MSAQQLLVKKNKDDDKKNKDDDKKNNKEDDKEKKNDKDKKDKDAPSQPKQQPQPPNPPRPPQQPSGKQKERDEIRSGFCFESDAFKYTLDDRIGDGGYGRVFEAEVAPKKEATKCPMKVAIKIEPRIQLNTVNIEAGVLQTAKDQRCQHFPTIYDSGTIALKPKYFSFISMELLGRDLYQLRKERKDFKFSLGTALRVGLESLEALRELHDVCGYISRDVKPGNFVTGLNTSDFLRSVFMIDFGLCRRFRDANNNLLPSRGDVGWRGTNRYGSLRAHRHLDLARRDDTESWFYMLVELTKGALSWAVIREREEIYNRKMAARTDDDFFRGCPAEYKELLAHIDELQFADAPGYAILTGILEKIMQRTGIERRGPMDWENGDDDSQPTGDERTSDPDSILRLHSAQKKQT